MLRYVAKRFLIMVPTLVIISFLPLLDIAAEATLNAMNIPATARLNQLKVNLTRLREMGSSVPPRFVMCNIPAAQIEAIENGVAVTRHTAVVGKPVHIRLNGGSLITQVLE